MKKSIIRITIYVLLIITFISLGIIGYQNRPQDRPTEEILGVTYYRYNPNTNNYDEFMINEEEISYKGSDYDFEGCKNYTYTPGTGIVKLDCNKAFRIGGESASGLIIEQGDIRTLFYATKENTYNYEFQKYFKTTESMYKSSGENALRTLEIDIDELSDLIKSNETSYIYIKDNSCDKTCTIFNHSFQNFSKDENIYYLDLTKISNENIEEVNETYDTFPDNLNELKKNYPQVLVVGNRELKEIIKIEINGFNTSKYENFANNYGEVNNEDNE